MLEVPEHSAGSGPLARKLLHDSSSWCVPYEAFPGSHQSHASRIIGVFLAGRRALILMCMGICHLENPNPTYHTADRRTCPHRTPESIAAQGPPPTRVGSSVKGTRERKKSFQ